MMAPEPQRSLPFMRAIFFVLGTLLIGLMGGQLALALHNGVLAPLWWCLAADMGLFVLLIAGVGAFTHANWRWAMLSIVATSIGTACIFVLSEGVLEHTLHLNTLLGFALLPLGIVIVGFIGDWRAILGASVFLTAFSCLAVYSFLPLMTAQPALNGMLLLVIIGVLWVVAACVLLGRQQYQRLARDLAAAEIAIEQSRMLDELKDQFISSVNHELRNPMMAMMNYVAVLTQRHEVMPVSRRTQLLGSLEQTGKRIIKLIGSILDVRQLEQRPEDFVPQSVPLRATLETAASLIDPMEARLGDRDLYLRVPASLEVWGDEVYVQQIFTNLLSNAVKYSGPTMPIEIEAKPFVAVGARGKQTAVPAAIEITVRDHGLGIPPEQIPLLFHRFVRLPRDLTSRVIGNGLGLYLCKVLTEAMGGNIWVESPGVDGEGSTFHVILPTVSAASDANGKNLAADKNAAPVVFGVPIGRARALIAASVALLVVGAGTLVIRQNQLIPAVAATGTVHFVDTPGGHFNGLQMTFSALPSLPTDAHYQAWLIDAVNEQVLSLGALRADNGVYSLDFQDAADGINLLSAGNQIEITQESGPSQAPLGKIVLSGTFPPKAFVHVRHLLQSFPTTPGQVGLLPGLRAQAQLLDQQAHLLGTTVGHNSSKTGCLTQNLLDILEGAKGAAYHPLSQNCRTSDIVSGDGFGLLSVGVTESSGYVITAAGHATLAIQQPDATTTIHTHGDAVIALLNGIKTDANALDSTLLALRGHTVSTYQAASVVALADKIFFGDNPPPNGGTPPPDGGPPPNGGAPPDGGGPDANAGGVLGAYNEGALMADLALTSSR